MCHKIFDVLHRTIGDSPSVRFITKMADFEVLEHSITRHVRYDADGFAGSLHSALDGTMLDAS